MSLAGFAMLDTCKNIKQKRDREREMKRRRGTIQIGLRIRLHCNSKLLRLHHSAINRELMAYITKPKSVSRAKQEIDKIKRASVRDTKRRVYIRENISSSRQKISDEEARVQSINSGSAPTTANQDDDFTGRFM